LLSSSDSPGGVPAGHNDSFALLVDILKTESIGTDDRDPLATVLWQRSSPLRAEERYR